MKKFLFALALLPLFVLSPHNARASAALAIDTNQGASYGWAINYSNQANADAYAVAQCGGSCSVVMRFTHTCAAYAADQTGGSTAYGWAYDPNVNNASNRALTFCQSRGGTGCIVRVWGCDR